MKKRKAPVLLLTLLIVLVGGVVVYGIDATRAEKHDASDAVTQQHDAPAASDITTSVANNTPTSSPNHATPRSVPIQGQQADGPSIAMPKDYGVWKKPKPPTDGATSSQWYH